MTIRVAYDGQGRYVEAHQAGRKIGMHGPYAYPHQGFDSFLQRCIDDPAAGRGGWCDPRAVTSAIREAFGVR